MLERFKIMAAVFGFSRSYHNHPEMTSLYQNICQIITGSHTDQRQDIKVLKDVLKDYKADLEI